MSARTHSWRCDLPGCRACGAGYPSDAAAARAERRHVASAPSSHQPLIERLGVGR